MVDAHEDLTTWYGATFAAAGVLGILMLAHLLIPWGNWPWRRHAYVAAFPVIFTFMVLMRFGY